MLGAATRPASAGGLAPSGKLPGGCESLIVVPPGRKRERGECLMKLEDVLQLLVVIGGTVGITFQIAWAIFKEIHNNKK